MCEVRLWFSVFFKFVLIDKDLCCAYAYCSDCVNDCIMFAPMCAFMCVRV